MEKQNINTSKFQKTRQQLHDKFFITTNFVMDYLLRRFIEGGQ